ncbi:MAG: tyrosine-type recombinase/integrase [Actinomycetota bacterium]|nr:tyrosine-type recombinase/integrase [Actinomycetota bacterium]
MAGRKHRPRGHIETRPNGTFRAVVYAGIDPLTGRERYLRKSARTHAEARMELTKLQSQVDEQRHPRSAITVDQVIEKWLDVTELEDTTRQRYQGLIRLYISPIFGSMVAAKLDAELLECFYARLRRCNKLCSERSKDHDCRPLSASTVRQIHFIIRAALDRAVRWRYLSNNEAALAKPPAFERPDPDPPSADEITALLNETWQDPAWATFLWLTMVSGCRRGEMCALRWTDLDLARGIMTVQRSYAQTTDGNHEKPTKTRQKRRVALDAHTVELLTTYRMQLESECTALGIELSRDAFVFSRSPNGSTPLLPSSVSHKYRRLATRLGLRSTRIHALRHYSATELLTAGVDLRTVAGRLGHGSGGATTLRFYAAWVDEADRRAADAIASLMPKPDPTRRTPRNSYEKVAAELRAAIECGELAAGAPLPTSIELAAQHNVSAGTV